MSASVVLSGWEDLVRQLERIDDQLTRKTAREMTRAATSVVAQRARELCPKGDPAHNPEAKPLRDTIGVVVRDYGDRTLAVVGPMYPAGAHGHLVEFGHQLVLFGVRTGGYVQGKPFMRPAFDETLSQQQAAMERVIERTLADL